jgi:hypothetical protein
MLWSLKLIAKTVLENICRLVLPDTKVNNSWSTCLFRSTGGREGGREGGRKEGMKEGRID